MTTPSERRVPMLPGRKILTFHGLGEPAGTIAAAERRYWVDAGVLRDAVARMAGDGGIEITFDDGNASDIAVALPILAEAGRRARFFVLAGRIGADGYLSRADIAELARHGMAIGSHGHDHVDWTKADDAGLRRELREARAVLEDACGQVVDSLSVPFGAFDARVLRAIAQAGYRSVHTSSGGLAGRGDWLVARTSVRADLAPAAILAGLEGTGARLKSALRNRLRLLRHGAWGLAGA